MQRKMSSLPFGDYGAQPGSEGCWGLLHTKESGDDLSIDGMHEFPEGVRRADGLIRSNRRSYGIPGEVLSAVLHCRRLGGPALSIYHGPVPCPAGILGGGRWLVTVSGRGLEWWPLGNDDAPADCDGWVVTVSELDRA